MNGTCCLWLMMDKGWMDGWTFVLALEWWDGVKFWN